MMGRRTGRRMKMRRNDIERIDGGCLLGQGLMGWDHRAQEERQCQRRG